MASDLPTNYDVIIVGTGLSESILAGAISKIGKTVLHIDRNGHYGGPWASLNLQQLVEWVKEDVPTKELVAVDGYTYEKTSGVKQISEVREEWFCDKVFKEGDCEEEIKKEKENSDSDEEKERVCSKEMWTKDKLLEITRQFSLDLSVNVLYCNGAMVDLIIQSDISKYTEYTNVNNLLIYLDRIEVIPSSKADVFKSRSMSVLDKRLLLKVLTTVLESNQDYDTSFYKFLGEQKISDKMKKQILHCIAMVSEDASYKQGAERVQKFWQSVGLFGTNSPFLWPFYGISDIIQGFCRISAVFGGTYCLLRGADALILENDACLGVVSENQNFFAEKVIISSNDAPGCLDSDKNIKKIPRAIFITNKSLHPKGKHGVSLLHAPLENETIRVLELDYKSFACPKGLYVVHFVGQIFDNYSHFEELASKFFNRDNPQGDKPKVLYQLYFCINQVTKPTKHINNLYVCSGPDPISIDYDMHVTEAKKLFADMYPSEEFYPKRKNQ